MSRLQKGPARAEERRAGQVREGTHYTGVCYADKFARHRIRNKAPGQVAALWEQRPELFRGFLRFFRHRK